MCKRREERLDFRGLDGIHSTQKMTGRGASNLVCGLLGPGGEKKIPTPIPRGLRSSNSCSKMSNLCLESLNHAYFQDLRTDYGIRLRTRLAPILPKLSNQFLKAVRIAKTSGMWEAPQGYRISKNGVATARWSATSHDC